MNYCVLSGNVGKDPEEKTTRNGNREWRFSIAVSRSVKNGDRWERVSDWYTVKTFSENAVRFVSKGSKVVVAGAWRFTEWEQEGQKKRTDYLLADTVEVINSRRTDDTSHDEADDLADDLSNVPF